MRGAILMPLDGSDLAARARPFAAYLARARGARRLLLRVPVVVDETNVETARSRQARLIAMTTHGRGGLARLVLGNVASETLKQASVPLLFVRPSTLRTGTDVTSTGRAQGQPPRATVAWGVRVEPPASVPQHTI